MTRQAIGQLITLADLAGTLVFAAEGALLAIHAHLDLLGISVIAFMTALGGGMLRDVLLGAYPVAALTDRRYAAAVILGTALAVVAGPQLAHWHRPVLLLDAAGLALFAASGASKALMRGDSGFSATVMGMLTATGGGALRDLMLGEVPAILRTGFYASAAILESILIVTLKRWGMPMPFAAGIGAAIGLLIRLAAIAGDWRLPAF